MRLIGNKKTCCGILFKSTKDKVKASEAIVRQEPGWKQIDSNCFRDRNRSLMIRGSENGAYGSTSSRLHPVNVHTSVSGFLPVTCESCFHLLRVSLSILHINTGLSLLSVGLVRGISTAKTQP